MRLDYSTQGLPRPIYEPGDLVRCRRAESGPNASVRAGDWGKVIRVGGQRVDLMLAGFSRPQDAAVPVALGLPLWLLEPCDRLGLPVELDQRDVNRARR